MQSAFTVCVLIKIQDLKPCFKLSADLVDFMPSLEDSKINILFLGPGKLMLNNADEYSQMTESGRIRKEARHTLATKMLVKLGYSEEEAEKKFENSYAFEEALRADAFITPR